MGEGSAPSRGRSGRLQARDAGAVPPRVRASWERCEEYGVPLETVDPVFTADLDEESLFFRCGAEVLAGLQDALVDEPVSLMLTDADGLVLNRLSADPRLVRALDEVRLAPGFSYAEREVGTSGLGLALADRAAVLVRAEEHYSHSLRGYTCAAAPVLDPLTGRLAGSVNLTTWSRAADGLLLALAQSAAAGTSALMLARSRGLTPRVAPGEQTRTGTVRREPGAGTLVTLSSAWAEPLDRAVRELSAGRAVLAVGEPGSGRTTLLAQALRRARPAARILGARTPAPPDVAAWLSVWTPELGKADTTVVVGDVDTLPSWAAQELRGLLSPGAAAGGALPVVFTAEAATGVPRALAPLVDTVVAVPALRERPDDVLPLAEHLARRARGRDVLITARAGRVLQGHPWPGGTAQLARVVGAAAVRSGTLDVADLPADVLHDSRRPLSRLEAVEREEIVRALTRPGATVKSAAAALGMGRATIYRKMQYYGIRLPERDVR